MSHDFASGPTASYPRFTPKQGQCLAFIHACTLVLGRPPAEADPRRHSRVTPPSVHREPGVARSIKLLIDPLTLPPPLPRESQSVKTPVQGY